MSSSNRSYRWLFWTLALIGLSIDQGSKYSIFAWLYPSDAFVIIPIPEQAESTEYKPAYFRLVAQYTDRPWEGEGLIHYLRTISAPNVPHLNHGALFGIGAGTNFGNYFFMAVSLIAAVAITFWSTRASAARDRYFCFALGLILAGTLGNFYDRLIFGGVRDFFHANHLPLPFGLDNFPVFNVADCCLVCGASLLVLEALFRKPAAETTPADTAAASEPAVMSS